MPQRLKHIQLCCNAISGPLPFEWTFAPGLQSLSLVGAVRGWGPDSGGGWLLLGAMWEGADSGGGWLQLGARQLCGGEWQLLGGCSCSACWVWTWPFSPCPRRGLVPTLE